MNLLVVVNLRVMEKGSNTIEQRATLLVQKMKIFAKLQDYFSKRYINIIFKAKGSAYIAALALLKHVESMETEQEKNYWITESNDYENLVNFILQSKYNMDGEHTNQKPYDVIEEICKFNDWKVENFFIEMIITSGVAESPFDREKWN